MIHGYKIGYVRVSTVDQNTDRQEEELRLRGIENFFIDKASGKNTERPALNNLIDFVREGDHVYVCSMDRLARNLKDLLTLVQLLETKKVSITFLQGDITFDAMEKSSSINKLLLSMLGAVAEFERSIILERQREGIAIAKARGVYKGRKPIDPALLDKAFQKHKEGVPVARIAKDLNIGRSTLFRYFAKRSNK